MPCKLQINIPQHIKKARRPNKTPIIRLLNLDINTPGAFINKRRPPPPPPHQRVYWPQGVKEYVMGSSSIRPQIRADIYVWKIRVYKRKIKLAKCLFDTTTTKKKSITNLASIPHHNKSNVAICAIFWFYEQYFFFFLHIQESRPFVAHNNNNQV